jgi:hypothetical protein
MSRRRLGLVVGVLTAAVLTVAALIVSADDERAAGVATIDEARGTYRGVGVGDDAATVRRVFGARSFARLNEEPISPTKADFAEIGGPGIDLPCQVGEVRGVVHFAVLRYEEVSFLLCDDRVFAWIAITADARTSRGLSLGDDLDKAEELYPGVTCGDAPSGDFGSYPYCAGPITSSQAGPRVHAWFGEDPIATITISTSGFDG